LRKSYEQLKVVLRVMKLLNVKITVKITVTFYLFILIDELTGKYVPDTSDLVEQQNYAV